MRRLIFAALIVAQIAILAAVIDLEDRRRSKLAHDAWWRTAPPQDVLWRCVQRFIPQDTYRADLSPAAAKKGADFWLNLHPYAGYVSNEMLDHAKRMKEDPEPYIPFLCDPLKLPARMCDAIPYVWGPAPDYLMIGSEPLKRFESAVGWLGGILPPEKARPILRLVHDCIEDLLNNPGQWRPTPEETTEDLRLQREQGSGPSDLLRKYLKSENMDYAAARLRKLKFIRERLQQVNKGIIERLGAEN